MNLLEAQIKEIREAQDKIKNIEGCIGAKWFRNLIYDRLGFNLTRDEFLKIDDLLKSFIKDREAAIEPLIDKLVKVESLIYPQDDPQ